MRNQEKHDNAVCIACASIIAAFALMGALGFLNSPAQQCVQPLEVYDARSE